MNCKPGDLAIVIGARRTAGIIGRIVEVVALAYKGERYITDAGEVPFNGWGPAWRVRTAGHPLPWALDMLGGGARIAYAQEAPVLDTCLRPISGVPIDDTVSDEVPHEQ